LEPGKYATGFLVGKNLIFTNHHALKTIEMAKKAKFQFFYDKEESVCKFTTAIDGTWATDENLDFTLISINPFEGMPRSIIVPPLDNSITFNTNDRCNIIGHPYGDPKQITIEENTIVKISAETMDYTTDTAKGSSGSPVFTNRWELIAIHHSAGEKKT